MFGVFEPAGPSSVSGLAVITVGVFAAAIRKAAASPDAAT
jgi:hypothetical protein